MITPIQIYDYLRYYSYREEKNIELLHLKQPGSKNLYDLVHAKSHYIDYDITNRLVEAKQCGGIMMMLEEEPFDLNAYCETSKEYLKNINENDERLELDPLEFILQKSEGLYKPIITISELRSNDVDTMVANYHIPFYYWVHGILARNWYSHYEIFDTKSTLNLNRFNCYIRDTSDTRKYRQDILDFFKTSHIDVYCPILNNPDIQLSSDLSAVIDWDDHNKYDIQIVTETIFHTEKTHLTEKVFRPIVMNQPFILFAGPRSLEYMRNYGFKTFASLWDESYDQELDSHKRYNKVIQLIEYINNLDDVSYKNMMKDVWKICKYNREYFYSDKFKNLLINEIKNGFNEALQIREEDFYKMPGGTLFYYDDLFYKKFGKLPKNNVSHKKALEFAFNKSKDVGKKILQKYSHLIN